MHLYSMNNGVKYFLNYHYYYYISYTRNHDPFLIINCSWILTIHKDRNLWKISLKTFLVFQNGVNNIQTTGYNGARTVCGMVSSIFWITLAVFHYLGLDWFTVLAVIDAIEYCGYNMNVTLLLVWIFHRFTVKWRLV